MAIRLGLGRANTALVTICRSTERIIQKKRRRSAFCAPFFGIRPLVAAKNAKRCRGKSKVLKAEPATHPNFLSPTDSIPTSHSLSTE